MATTVNFSQLSLGGLSPSKTNVGGAIAPLAPPLPTPLVILCAVCAHFLSRICKYNLWYIVLAHTCAATPDIESTEVQKVGASVMDTFMLGLLLVPP